MGNGFRLPSVDKADPTPRYLQAQQILIEAIRGGHLRAGAKLPSTKDFSSLVNVSLITAHKAMEGLVESGWLQREVGRGTFVRADLDVRGEARRRIHVGLLLDKDVCINDYYHSTIIDGLRREARCNELGDVEFFFQDRASFRRPRRSRDVGVICFHPLLESRPEVEHLAEKVPVLLLGGGFSGSRLCSVECDNYQGARSAVDHLLELGHRRFLVLTGCWNLSNSRDRAMGADDRLMEAGIVLGNRDHLVSTESAAMDSRARAKLVERMRSSPRPTAIVAGGFYLALSARQAVRELGLRVPEDVSIVGFDDPDAAALLDPPLTTVCQPLADMASLAYRQVRRAILMRNRPIMSNVKLATKLVVRSSTGPAAA